MIFLPLDLNISIRTTSTNLSFINTSSVYNSLIRLTIVPVDISMLVIPCFPLNL